MASEVNGFGGRSLDEVKASGAQMRAGNKLLTLLQALSPR
jgi:hypothetical protein